MAGSSQQSKTRDLEQGGEIFELSKTEIEWLRSLLGSLDKKAEKGTYSLALTGTSSLSFSLHASENLHQNYWILDSGASDHMTSYPHLVHLL